jgi:signal transduction histidine kinase
MPLQHIRWIRSYLLAILTVFLALQAKWFIQPYISTSPPFITFLAAIMFTAWHGGFRPALLATVLSAVLIDYYFIFPLYSFPLTPADLGTLAFFGFIGTTVAYAIDHLQKARHDAVTSQKQLEHLHELSRQLLNREEFEPMLQSVLTAVLELLDANKGVIQLYDPETKTLEMRTHIGFNQEELSNHFHKVSLDFSSCGAAVQRKQRVLIEQVAADPTFSSLASLSAMSEVVSVHSMPLFRADRGVFGVLTTYHSRPFPSEREFHLVDLYVRQAERALETKYHEEGLRRTNADLEANLRSLVAELAGTEERERRLLASELHDYLAQVLSLGQIKLTLAQRFMSHSPGKSEKYILETADAINRSLEYARTLIAELCPPELYDAGLPAAVRWLAAQMLAHGLTVESNITLESLALPKDRTVLLYKSIRELLLNVVKHAMVDQARLSMSIDSNNTLVIRVQDGGRGFDTSSPPRTDAVVHFGLANMRERMTMMGGWYQEESAIGRGTTITLGLPLHLESRADSLRAPSTHQQARVQARPKDLPSQESLPLG